MHCVDCGQNFGDFCVSSHRKMKMSASHRLIPLHGAPKEQAEVSKSGSSTHHDALCVARTEMEIDSKCITAEHSGHTFSLLSQKTLQKQIDDCAIAVTKREEEARKAIATLDGTMNKIEKHCSAAEEAIATLVFTLHAAIDARHAVLVTKMRDKGDQLKMTVKQEKEKAESAAAEFREFHSFTEGLLAQETPFDIADAHKKVSV